MQPQYSTLVGLGDVGETCHAYPNSMFLTPSPDMSEKQGLAGKSNGGACFFFTRFIIATSTGNHGFYDHLLDWILIGDLSFLDDIIGVYTTGFSRLSPGGWIAASGWSKTISKMWRSSGHHI